MQNQIKDLITEFFTVQFGLSIPVEIQAFDSGLINHSWKVITSGGIYVLQKINHAIFKDPFGLDENIRNILNYLKQHFPQEVYPELVQAKNGATIVLYKSEYYRIFYFIPDSHSIDVVKTSRQAFAAAAQFALFTARLKNFPAEQLNITIPDFHDLAFRQQQFDQAITEGNRGRIMASFDLINQLSEHKDISNTFCEIKDLKKLPIRVIHHDTKISNVLFNRSGSAICPIDLDTVMPGFFISDLGDMMRTYLSPANENEQDLNKISIRKEFYDSIIDGYLTGLGTDLAPNEKSYLHYSGEFIIYMQALRFMTDFLNDDIYYGSKFENQNLMRAQNQLRLLELYRSL